MLRAVLLSAIALALMGATFCGESGEGHAATAASAEAHQRFVINFCYAQYRSQSDVMRCLAQGI